MFYLELALALPQNGGKTPRRRIAADIAMRKHAVAHAQAKCHLLDLLVDKGTVEKANKSIQRS